MLHFSKNYQPEGNFRIGDNTPTMLTKIYNLSMLRASLLFIACTFAATEITAQMDFSIVRPDGIGPIRVGMNLSELNRALHTSFKKPTDPDEQACTYVEVPRQSGIEVMILDGRVARVDIDNTSTRTAEGIHNGDSEARAVQVYGKRLKIEPNHYDPENGHYLTLRSPNRKYGIRFESDDGKITRYYAGTANAIAFVEGCS